MFDETHSYWMSATDTACLSHASAHFGDLWAKSHIPVLASDVCSPVSRRRMTSANSSLVQNRKEDQAPKNWCFEIVMLEKTPDLDYKKIKPVNLKGSQSWTFIVRTVAKLEIPILWPPDAESWLTGKDLEAGKDWGQEGKRGQVRGWDGWRASLTQWTWIWANSWEMVKDREAQSAAVHGVTKSWNWTWQLPQCQEI